VVEEHDNVAIHGSLDVTIQQRIDLGQGVHVVNEATDVSQHSLGRRDVGSRATERRDDRQNLRVQLRQDGLERDDGRAPGDLGPDVDVETHDATRIAEGASPSGLAAPLTKKFWVRRLSAGRITCCIQLDRLSAMLEACGRDLSKTRRGKDQSRSATTMAVRLLDGD
jgi:hypothetical protein